MSKIANRDWADDDEFEDANALPEPQTISNKDGSKTVITFSFNEAGKKVKLTRRIKTTTKTEKVNPRVAERKGWAKFGNEKGKGAGPSVDTTTVGENIFFRPSVSWKRDARDEGKKAEEETMKDKLRDKKVKCRICDGEHFTARCPYKDTMAPAGEPAGGAGAGMDDDGDKEGGLGIGGSSYVPPHLRKGAAGREGDRMGGKFERDDFATLRVTNVSEFADENELRSIFERHGRVTRVFLAKDRETGRAKGFAFISFAAREDAQRACDKLDGFLYEYLVLKVEFAKRADK